MCFDRIHLRTKETRRLCRDQTLMLNSSDPIYLVWLAIDDAHTALPDARTLQRFGKS